MTLDDELQITIRGPQFEVHQRTQLLLARGDGGRARVPVAAIGEAMAGILQMCHPHIDCGDILVALAEIMQAHIDHVVAGGMLSLAERSCCNELSLALTRLKEAQS